MAAYNLRDTDRNGYGNTWYADPRVQSVDLRRPFLKGRLPQWPGPFVRWFAHRRYAADFYSDEDLDSVASGRRLASRYSLVVFAGHEEYVTQHVFTMIKRYRDLGGNLAFLSANNFYARVTVSRSRMRCIGRFRDLGQAGGGSHRRPVPRLVAPALPEQAVRRAQCRGGSLAVPGHGPAQG